MIPYLQRFRIIRPEYHTCLTIQDAIPYLVQRIEQKTNNKKGFVEQQQTKSCDRITASSSS
ncbi:hypothetical protein PM8797T_01959 [Gimesia maris DSM 8797]|uniref:Uncharacterized protein n=1 Tax=Gimesia maris TaxID=122 RepID=A0ABX5YKH1_9PLAN|nr:hypothetical protein PM8797T_01959 [Gimesia maris DSM 8797]QDU14147.1 hypothetical protein CA11_19510 [Gimesia maris]QEG16167.1 hypothetical protein GmarT_20280 [Gimesia maris]